jgi:uncharacterized membrane protein (UPF0127 family)
MSTAVKLEKAVKALIAAALLCVWTTVVGAELPQVTLAVGKHKLTTEVASTDPDRSTGLMHRRMLPEDRAMLFVFPDVAYHAMWMMNTYVPLSVAFLDRDGVIINIADMQPQTTDSHRAARPAKYALEVNQGWFRKRGIKPGDKIDGLEKAGPAK